MGSQTYEIEQLRDPNFKMMFTEMVDKQDAFY